METLTKIRQWAEDRNLIKGATPQAQMLKLTEEIGELAHGVARNEEDVVLDSIGDAVVVLTILAAQYNMNIEDCVEAAYHEIKDRKGRMIDGIFVKEEDLPTEPQGMVIDSTDECEACQ